MPTIRISERNYQWLQSLAEPWVDTPDDVLSWVRETHNQKRQPTPAVRSVAQGTTGRRRGMGTPEEDYRIPILKALEELGGRGRCAEVVKRVGGAMEHILNEYDRGTNKSGDIRWQNHAQWERKHMVDDGLLERNSPHGVWEITGKGREYLEESRAR